MVVGRDVRRRYTRLLANSEKLQVWRQSEIWDIDYCLRREDASRWKSMVWMALTAVPKLLIPKDTQLGEKRKCFIIIIIIIRL